MAPPPSPKKRIVLLGTGYAGIHAYLELEKKLDPQEDVEVVIVSDHDHLLFVTMIYEIAAGNLAPSSIRQSVRILLDKDLGQFIHGKVHHVDFDNKTIGYKPHTAAPGSTTEFENTLSYDFLVIALGSKTNFYGLPGADEHCLTLKSLKDGKRVKNRVIKIFEQTELMTDELEMRKLLSIAIIGGGPTGITLASKLADMINHEIKDAFPRSYPLATISIIQGGAEFLPQVDRWFHKKTVEILTKKKCIQIFTNARAKEIRQDGIVTEAGFIPARTVIWTAGVKAQDLDLHSAREVQRDERTSRIKVNNYLQVHEYPDVFVTGDQAWVVDKETGQPYPMRAQFAVRQGKVAARNIVKSLSGGQLEEFFWKDKGFIVSLGHRATLAEVFGFKFSGILATTAYKFIYMMNTIGIRAKVRASVEWFLNVFLPRDISEL